MKNTFDINGRRLSYIDFGGPGRPLLALHGHMSEGGSFSDLARELAPDWRVIALDQRGHGESDRAPDYTRDGYIADIAALLDQLGPMAVLGHSLGGINAYQLAARRPDLVTALINLDAPVVVGSSALGFVLAWPYQAPTREALLQGLGPAAPMFVDTVRECPDGSWRLPFHPQDMVTSEENVQGDHWADWLASTCPALLVHGTRSQALPKEQAQAMAERRPNTSLAELDTDHFIYAADPPGVAKAVREFLDQL
jgi:pimeloyl-ACP methyl ester carboxylesterase